MAKSFTKLELNYTGSLYVSGVGHIRCPTINEIIEGGGEDAYNNRIMVLLYTKSQLAENINSDLSDDLLKELNNTPLFIFLIANDATREVLLETLSFFFDEQVVFDESTSSFLTIDRNSGESIGSVNYINYEEVRGLILQRNYMSLPKESVVKKKSKRAMEREAKIAEGRKKSKKYKDRQESMRLDNITSKLAARSPSLNIQDVYKLTIYQLYDQFTELNISLQIDTILTRWSIWGKDDFDFSIWCRPNN